MAAVIAMKRLDDGLVFDPVISKIFVACGKSEDEGVADLIELMLYRLWLTQGLKSKDNDDSTLASSLSTMTFDREGSSQQEVNQKIEWQIESWRSDAERVKERINVLMSVRKIRGKARAHLLELIAKHNVVVPKESKAHSNLVILLYGLESRAMYDTAVRAAPSFDPARHFQFQVVTWISACGGEPKVVETHNFMRSATWPELRDFLTRRTRTTQVSSLGYENGLSLKDGSWRYRLLLTLSEEVIEANLTSEMDFMQMAEYAVSFAGSGKILITHDVLANIPLAIARGHPPEGFRGKLEDEPFDLSQARGLLGLVKFTEKKEPVSEGVGKNGRSTKAREKKKYKRHREKADNNRAAKSEQRREEAGAAAAPAAEGSTMTLAFRPAGVSLPMSPAVAGAQEALPPPQQQELPSFNLPILLKNEHKSKVEDRME